MSPLPYRLPLRFRLFRSSFASLIVFLMTSTAKTATAKNISITPLTVNESISSTSYLLIAVLIVAISFLLFALNILALAIWFRYIHPSISLCPLPGRYDQGACLAASVRVDQVEGTK